MTDPMQCPLNAFASYNTNIFLAIANVIYQIVSVLRPK